MLRITLIIFCLLFTPSIAVSAKAEECLYNNTEEFRYIDNIDEYLEQLNSGLITPTNTTITIYEPMATPFSIISEPSKSCSNIFGHSWGNWNSWYEISRVHNASTPCISVIERWRYCTRTHCGASQKETDTVWITSCIH